jgi:hypothetical protein
VLLAILHTSFTFMFIYGVSCRNTQRKSLFLVFRRMF